MENIDKPQTNFEELQVEGANKFIKENLYEMIDSSEQKELKNLYENFTGKEYKDNINTHKRLFSILFIKKNNLTLTKYLNKLGISSDFKSRKRLYQKHFGNFYKYKGTLNQNIELFHSLVIKNEIAKELEKKEKTQQEKKDIQKLKNEIEKENIEKLNQEVVKRLYDDFGVTQDSIQKVYENFIGDYDNTYPENKNLYSFLYIKVYQTNLDEYIIKKFGEPISKSKLYEQLLNEKYEGDPEQNFILLHKLIQHFVLGEDHSGVKEIKLKEKETKEKLKYLNQEVKKSIKKEFGINNPKEKYNHLIGKYEDSLECNKRLYCLLFIKQKGFILNEYIKNLGYDYKDKEKLYYNLVGSLGIYKGTKRQNLELFYKLIEKHQLGEEFIEFGHQQKEQPFNYEKLGIRPSSYDTVGKIKKYYNGKYVSMCSKTVRLDFRKNFNIFTYRGDSDKLFKRWVREGGKRTIAQKIDSKLKYIFIEKKDNLGEVCIKSKEDYHRLPAFLGKNGKIYTVDEYYTGHKNPIPIKNHPLVKSYPKHESVISPKSFKV